MSLTSCCGFAWFGLVCVAVALPGWARWCKNEFMTRRNCNSCLTGAEPGEVLCWHKPLEG